ncbi:MAG: tRNA lysidine(34) synthetase TilS [Ignavibacteria bacterium]|nr:tRNA lysidine(34) synthetase TilS [Ignavibacteria bacterium]
MFSSRTFLTRFHEYSRQRRLIEDRGKIIAAVSGGVDSVVMLDLLAREAETLGLSVIVAHFNHQLRGEESDADEEHVAQLARHYGYEFYVERSTTGEYAKHYKLGIQEAARKLRYRFFDRLLVSSGFDRVATAHNADDNAETVLLNLFRGAGVQGLSGIPVFREEAKVIRPLLFAPRIDIEQFALHEQLEYRKDSSNEKDLYSRNYLRHHIFPLVKENINPSVVQTLQRSAELFRELEAFLTYSSAQSFEMMVAKRNEDELHLSIPRLRSNPVLMQQYVVMLAAKQFAQKQLEYEQVNGILSLTEGLTGAWVPLSREYVVFRDRENLVFRKAEEPPEFHVSVQPNHRYEFDQFLFSSETVPGSDFVAGSGNGSVEFLDADRVGDEPLVLRTWEDGDAFVPLGMKASKKISDFFVDEKIPIYQKHHIPILETRTGDVVWVCGHRIDDRFKVTDETVRVIKVEFSRTRNESKGSP